MSALWTVIADKAIDAVFGYQSANKIKNNIIALASARIQRNLGGSRQTGITASGVTDALDYIDVEINGTQLSGLTVRVRVEVRTSNAGTSVTPRLYNTTTAAAAVTGVACTATSADYTGTNSKQTLTFTPTTGVNVYRLQLTPSNNSNAVYGIGHIEILADA